MRKKGRSRSLAAVIATLGACLLAMALSIGAQADFTPPYTTQCSGGIAHNAATGLQSGIIGTWRSKFELTDTSSPLACPKLGPGVRFHVGTSAEALEALGSVGGVRNTEFSFAGNEEPPTLAQWLSIDLGDKPLSDSGLIRQIPVASTAVVPVVNFPEGCKIPTGERTSDDRFAVSNAQLEKVYSGAIATWGELLPDIEAACASTPIKRVVPSASDGTTFVFKQWLATVDPSLGWNSLSNTVWPKDSGATATVRSSGGDLGESFAVNETSGSVGFASLPSAREAEFGLFGPNNPSRVIAERLFWLSVQNGTGEQIEPTRDPESGEDDIRGANCDNPHFNYVPSGYDTTVTPVWRSVSAVGSSTGWPICTLTYEMTWDDASTVYGSSEERQAEQRTVKDFLAYVLGPAGQKEAEERDYSPLPSTVLADAQDGQSRVGWDKVAGSKEEKEAAVRAEITTAERHSNP